MPPKSIITLTIIVFGILAGAIFMRSKTTVSDYAKGIKNSNGEILRDSLVASAINKDTDGDGLADWEEALWKSDINNRDTDGDGITDGEEVISGRDPLVYGVGSLNNRTETILSNSQIQESDEDIEETAKMGRELFLRYLAVKRDSSGPLSAEQLASIVSSVSNSAERVQNDVLYTTANIEILDTNTQSSFKKYGNAIGALAVRYAPPQGGKNELEVFLEVIHLQSDPSELKIIDPYIKNYEGFVKDALLVPVPKRLSIMHLELINSFRTYGQDLKKIRFIEKDPLPALMVLGVLVGDLGKAYESMMKMADFFKQEGIVFQATDQGSVFMGP